MYDPITASLLRSGPPLPDLNRHDLPKLLTRVYAHLVSVRLRVRQARTTIGVRRELDLVRRLANTYETCVAVLPERSDRRAAAFVAATAHALLAMAERSQRPDDAPALYSSLASNYISSDIAACLLFLAAGYTADAAETAKRFRQARDVAPARRKLLQAIRAIAVGDLARAIDLSSEIPRSLAENDVDRATDTLYARVLEGVHVLASGLRDGGSDTLRATRTFDEVRDSSVRRILDLDDEASIYLSSFGGPHHLATLLKMAASALQERATSRVPSPPGIGTHAWSAALTAMTRRRPFLWESHQRAIEKGYLQPSVSAVFSFPTGAGKSTMAELKIASALANNGRVLYLVPTHALVSQVVRDLKETFPEVAVGDSLVSDGVYVELNEVPGTIAVMTPERALTLMTATPESFKELGLIVLDECHLIHPAKTDKDRRGLDAMLCVLIATSLAPGADVLFMSAMMANAAELAQWIGELTTRQCVDATVDWKPARQIRGCVVFDQAKITALEQLLATARRTRRTKFPNATIRSQLAATPHAVFGLHQTWLSEDASDYLQVPLLSEEVPLAAGGKTWMLTANRNKVAARLAAEFAKRGMRTMVFAQSVVNARSLAEEVATVLTASIQLTAEEQDLRERAVEEVGAPEHVLGLTDGGAVFHHGLLLPVERRLVEDVFRREQVHPVVLVGTPTLAQGINLPAEVVILAGDDRFDEDTKKPVPLKPHELLNAVGRAGRAGSASVGIVVVVPGTVIASNRANLEMSSGWSRLQKDVFSKVDQCLSIDDPIEVMMDSIQTGNAASDEARYFLNRLPQSDEEAAVFLRRSFGAFRARQRAQEQAFEQKTAQVIGTRSQDVQLTHDMARQMGASLGIDVSLADEMLRDVADNASQWDGTDAAVVVAEVFRWLEATPQRATAMVKEASLRLVRESEKAPLEQTLTRMRDLVLRWMSGETLVQMQVSFADAPAKSKGCIEARKFVLRVVPEVAHTVGLFAYAYRLHFGEDATLPIGLAVAGECIKKGVASAELLAVSHKLGDVSRAAFRRRLEDLTPYLDSGSDDVTFDDVRNRIESAMGEWAEAGDEESDGDVDEDGVELGEEDSSDDES